MIARPTPAVLRLWPSLRFPALPRRRATRRPTGCWRPARRTPPAPGRRIAGSRFPPGGGRRAQPGTYPPLGDGEFLFSRGLPRVRKRITIVRPKEQQVHIRSLHAGQTGIPAGDRKGGEIFKAARLMAARNQQSREVVMLFFQPMPHRGDKDDHMARLPGSRLRRVIDPGTVRGDDQSRNRKAAGS
jgi:hypothetical protein